MNNRERIRILLVEDSDTDVLLLKEAFADMGGFEHELIHVTQLAEGLNYLQQKALGIHVVLLDLGLPDSQGVETFARIHQVAPELPVLVLTALNDESAGVAAMKEGAQDYLIKDQVQPALLGRSVRYAIERQRINQELLISQQRLRDLAARLQDVREAERTHIAREVHDELGQMLTGMKMDLGWMERKLGQPAGNVATVLEKIDEAKKLADRAIEIIQRIALELRPSVLDNLGLVEAIRDDGRRFENRTGLKLKMDLPEELPKFERAAMDGVFRIFQELVTNIIRHAQAEEVAIKLAAEDGLLALTVMDDGVGMPPDAPRRRNSLGLLGMSERALSLGGKIQFESRPGKGTCVTLKIPFTPG